MEWLTIHWTDIVQVIAYIIAGASVIVKLTPTLKDDAVLAQIIKFLAVLSLNKSDLTK